MDEFNNILQQILLKNGVSQKQIEKIIPDLHESLDRTDWLIAHEDWIDGG